MSTPIFDELANLTRRDLIVAAHTNDELVDAYRWSPLPDTPPEPPMLECRNWALETIRTAYELWYRP